MIHSGSRGLGHQVATDALVAMEKAMKRDGIHVNDRQVCTRMAARPAFALSIVPFFISYYAGDLASGGTVHVDGFT
jgi:hypothetical protein